MPALVRLVQTGPVQAYALVMIWASSASDLALWPYISGSCAAA
jgi:hypothetical protein